MACAHMFAFRDCYYSGGGVWGMLNLPFKKEFLVVESQFIWGIWVKNIEMWILKDTKRGGGGEKQGFEEVPRNRNVLDMCVPNVLRH